MVMSKVRVLMPVFGISSLLTFATVALSEEVPAPAVVNPTAPAAFVSDGSVLKLGDIAIAPIKGWNVEPRSLGMTLIMKEVPAPTTSKVVDYSQPVFARNITLMTLPEGAPIDEERASEFSQEYMKIVAKDASLKDFQITSHKFFSYKGENDGLVFFSQLTVNGFPMMQMHILVSNEAHQYLMTYTDLTSHFATPESYDAAWKSMTSITIPGVAPVRYMHEARVAGTVMIVLLALMAPLMLARIASSRRLRLAAADLNDDWDHGRDSQDDDFTNSNIALLDQTHIAGRIKKSRGRDADINVSAMSDLGQTWVVNSR